MKPNPYKLRRVAKPKIIQQQQTPIVPQERTHRHLWKGTKVAVAFLVAVVGLVLGITNFVGPPWPTEPIFSPGLPSAGSPFDVPFTVTNRSAFFDIWNLNITCVAVKIIVHLKGTPPWGVDHIGFGILPVNPLLPAGKSDTYVCPIRHLIGLHPAGSGPSQDFADGIIDEAQIEFKSAYDAPILSGRHGAASDIFTLDTQTSPPRWTVGKGLK